MIVTQERLHVISDNIHKMLNRGANQRIKKMFDRIHAADIALLFRTFSFHQRLKLISLISLPEKTAEVVSELDEEIKNELLTELPIDTMVEILSHMSSDDAADALGNLPEEISQKILALLPGEGKELEGLLQFDDETAGGLMSAEFFALEEKTTASEAINALQRAGDLEMAFYIYVINCVGNIFGVVA